MCHSAFVGEQVYFTASYYVNRIFKYSLASPSCCIVALVYLERFQAECPGLRLNSKTVQRLLLVAIMTAAKYLDDTPCSHRRWYVAEKITSDLFRSIVLYTSEPSPASLRIAALGRLNPRVITPHLVCVASLSEPQSWVLPERVMTAQGMRQPSKQVPLPSG